MGPQFIQVGKIESLSDIIDDMVIEAEHLGDTQAIIHFYNQNFTKVQIIESLFTIVRKALIEKKIRVALEIKDGEFLPTSLTPDEVVKFVYEKWNEMKDNDPMRDYILWILRPADVSVFKQSLVRAAKSDWVKTGPRTEKLVYSASSINPGLTFVLKEKDNDDKPVIETWKNNKFISRQSFENQHSK